MPNMIYLDNAATTAPSPEVCEAVLSAMRGQYGNPSSLHGMGIEAERLIDAARGHVAGALGVRPDRVYFMSGGTEANNAAILGLCRRGPKGGANVIVTTAMEHPSVLKPIKEAEGAGWQVIYIKPLADGTADLDYLEETLDARVALIVLTHVNNETGAVQHPEGVVSLRDRKCPRAIIHFDCVQSFGKLPVMPPRAGVDIVSVSAHKIHGPKGVGAIYISEKAKLQPILFGGGQEGGMRSGTENVPAIAGFGAAAREVNADAANADAVNAYTADAGAADNTMRNAERNASRNAKRVAELNNAFVEGVEKSSIKYQLIFAHDKLEYDNPNISNPEYDCSKLINPEYDNPKFSNPDRSPYILPIAFPGIRAEVLLNHLSREGVCVSAGAACSSRRSAKTGSHVLTAMGLSRDIIDSTIRISFSKFNTVAEVEAAVEKLVKAAAEIRR